MSPLFIAPPTDTDADARPGKLPYARQFALQCAAAFAVLSVVWPFYGIRNEPLPWLETSLLIGGTALLIACISRQPWWWRIIHALFAPLVCCFSWLEIPPGWFLLAFILLFSIHRGAFSGQIPLFLSNRKTASAIAKLVSDSAGKNFIDLGAGIGSIARPLAKALPGIRVTGIENSPIPWLLGFMRTKGLKNCKWTWGDFWKSPLSDYDVVYAFLSPAPMPALWQKILREMRPGSLFVSNGFPVPGAEASLVLDIDDQRRTRLFCYRL